MRIWLPVVLSMVALPVGLLAQDDADLLKAVKDRMKVEAQRVEKKYADGRAAAYALVKRDSPRLTEATQQLDAVLAMLENDTSLDQKRRQTLIGVIRWDRDRVRVIADEKLGKSGKDLVLPKTVIDRFPRGGGDEERRNPTKDAKSVIDKRKEDLYQSQKDRVAKNDKTRAVMNDVVKSAIPESAVVSFPRDWMERTRMRGSTARMSAKERQIMAALNKTISVDFTNKTFSEVMDYLKAATGLELAVDRRGLESVNVTYDTSINLKMRSTARTVIRRILADLGLAYYIRDEAIQITSLERARQETTIRTYYIGDLALVTDTRIPFDLGRLQALQTINVIIDQIKGMEPQSWRDNNPEAPGTIAFDPVRMSLIIRQSAEFHFRMSGK